MSKVRRYTNYDNDPNSIFGASKRVIQEYKRKLESEKTLPKGLRQGVETEAIKTSGDNLGKYSSMIRGITGNLEQALNYLQEEEKTEPQLIGFGRNAYRYRGGAPPDFKTREEAKAYLLDKLDKQGSKNIDPEDKEIISKYKIVDSKTLTSKGATKKADKWIKIINENPNTQPYKTDKEILDYFEKKPKASALGEDLEDEEEEQERREEEGDEALEARAEANPRFTDKPTAIDIHGGQPDEDEKQQEEFNENWMNEPLPDDEEWLKQEEEEVEEDPENPEEIEGDEGDEESYFDYNQGESEEEEEGKEGEETEGEEEEPQFQQRTYKQKKEVSEKFLLSLLSRVVSQINDAHDFWETNISPNLASIPAIKFDSFINGKILKDFEDVIAEFEGTATKDVVRQYFNYLDKVYMKVMSLLDDLFNLMESDNKKYKSGINVSGGYLPVKSPYNPFLNKSKTKYLM
jgi:hypothetical protein